MAFNRGAAFTPQEVGDFYCDDGVSNPHASGALIAGWHNLLIKKSDTPGPRFWGRHSQTITDSLQEARVGLFHVRLATHGHPSHNENNHPITHIEHGFLKAALVHNGVVNPPVWLKGKGTCDSEQLLLYYLRDGFKSWGEFRGYGTVVLFEPPQMYCYTSTGQLYYRAANTGLQLRQIPGNGWTQVPTQTVFYMVGNNLESVVKVEMKGDEKKWASGWNSCGHLTDPLWHTPAPVFDRPVGASSSLRLSAGKSLLGNSGPDVRSQPPVTGRILTTIKHSHRHWVNVGPYRVGIVSQGESPLDYDLFLALDSCWMAPGEIFSSARSRVGHGQRLYVHWPEFGVIPRKDYLNLVNYLHLTMLHRDNKRVVIGCTTGHGRAGVVLAGLIARVENVSGDEALRRARTRLCFNVATEKAYEEMVKAL